MGREDLVGKIRDYCETLEGCDPVDVEAACRDLAKVDSPFIPSAGQIYSAAQRLAAKRFAEYRASQPKLAAPARGIDAVPESERAAQMERIQRMLSSWRQPEASQ